MQSSIASEVATAVVSWLLFIPQAWLNFPSWMQGKGLGDFHDIDRLTMFADYRVPVVLRELGVLKYSKELDAKVQP